MKIYYWTQAYMAWVISHSDGELLLEISSWNSWSDKLPGKVLPKATLCTSYIWATSLLIFSFFKNLRDKNKNCPSTQGKANTTAHRVQKIAWANKLTTRITPWACRSSIFCFSHAEEPWQLSGSPVCECACPCVRAQVLEGVRAECGWMSEWCGSGSEWHQFSKS